MGVSCYCVSRELMLFVLTCYVIFWTHHLLYILEPKYFKFLGGSKLTEVTRVTILPPSNRC